jgi:hypothetical protein
MTRKPFPLFQTPLDLAHTYWQRLLKPGDHVVDATCGNGHDTLFLVHLLSQFSPQGFVTALDTQLQAIENTRHILSTHISNDFLDHVSLHQQCHSVFPTYLEKGSVALIVYNLGYLPGGDKALTTSSSTTQSSLAAALSLIKPGGAISITCYPGHEAGKLEEDMVLNFAASLNPQEWSACHHVWLNRRQAPSLVLLQRSHI